MFRFTIRDLLWLTVVCAVAAYGYRDHRAMELRVAKMEEERRTEKEQLAHKMMLADGKMKLADRKLESAVESSKHAIEQTRFLLELMHSHPMTPARKPAIPAPLNDP
jgi:hypothetical protein